MNTRPKVTVAALQNKKRSNQKITLLTAYDFPMASFLDQAGIDIVLVSDAVGTIGNGRPEAFSVTVGEMVYHTRAVRNGVKSALVVTTLPFGSYNCVNEAASNATRIMKEGRADAVHLEGTAQSAEIVRSIVESGIPVLGHIGVTKQRIALSGNISLPAKDAESSKEDDQRCRGHGKKWGFRADHRVPSGEPGRNYYPQPGYTRHQHRLRRSLRWAGPCDP